MKASEQVIVRIAPSPTGWFHVGTLRTALFNYLYARGHKGTFLLRVEDTDKERSLPEYTDDIISSLEWLGLSYDERSTQSEHVARHRAVLEDLIAKNLAYVSNEREVSRETVSAKADMENRRESVIRFRNPGKVVTFHDLILGDISVDTTDLGDFVIAKDLDTPLYNFVVVVDDIDMHITQVIRGQDHIANTPRQILIYEALGAVVPEFAHIPLIMAPDKTKLSKRKHAEIVSIKSFRERGYLPEALINFFALLGWNPGTEREMFSLQELVENFSIEKVQKSSAVFNIDKLDWFNKEYIKKLSHEAQEEAILEFLPESIKTLSGFSIERLHDIVPIIVDHVSKWSDVHTMADAGELAYFFDAPNCTAEQLIWKNSVRENAAKHLEDVAVKLEAMNSAHWNAELVKEEIMPYAEEVGKGNVLWPMRVALSGKDKSPDPFTLAGVLGRDETLQRIHSAIEILQS